MLCMLLCLRLSQEPHSAVFFVFLLFFAWHGAKPRTPFTSRFALILNNPSTHQSYPFKGTCVCAVLITKDLFSISIFNQGEEGMWRSSAQRSSPPHPRKTYLLCIRPGPQCGQLGNTIHLQRQASVGVTPKELCKCVTSTGILSKGRA